MKKYFLVLSSILLLFFFVDKVFGQQTVLNGANTSPVNFPTGTCTYTWTNNNTSIGLAASGTGNIPSFKAVNTGSSPVTATLTGTPAGTVGFAYIVNSGSNSVSVINVATSSVVATIGVGSNPNGVCVDPNYNEVYIVNNSSNTVSVINTLTNTVTATIPVGPSPWSVTVSPDGSRAYVADGGNNDVEVINTTTNTIVDKIPAGTNPNASVVSPDGSLIYVNNSNSVSVINTTTHVVAANIPVGSAPQAILITPDGSKVYEANYGSNDVYVINTATNTVAKIIPVGTNPGGGSMSPDGSVVYIANEGSNSVSVISTATNAVIKTIPVGASPWGVSVRPDGKQIYVANSGSNTISVVDASTNAIISNISVGSEPYSFGNFFTAGMNCTEIVKYTITVNPGTSSSPTITATAASGNISACSGTASASPNLQQFKVSGSGLTGNITAAAPAGFEVSLTAVGGYASSITIPQSSGTVSSTVVYVRSAATASAGSIAGKVILTSSGASNQTIAVAGAVNALPTVNAIGNQTVNNGAPVAAINFTGTGTTFNWVNDTPRIGLAASGTGNIASFTGVNTGSSQVKATVTVTSVRAGFAYIANTASNTVSVISMVSKTVVATIPVGQSPIGVSVSPDGSLVYIANQGSGDISVISAATNKVIATITLAQSAEPSGIVASPDGSRVYTADYRLNTVSVINTATNAVISVISVGNNPYGISISPDGSRVYVTNVGDNTVSVINTATNAVVATIATGGLPNDVCLSPDGSRLYSANYYTNNVSVVNTATNAVIATISVGANPVDVAVSPDGTTLYVMNINDGTVSVVSTATNIVTGKINIGAQPTGGYVSPDGKWLYVANNGSSKVSIINTATNTIDATVAVGLAPLSFGNFISPYGCASAPTQFTITVNPDPATAITITASTVTGTISACAGAASASPQIQQFTVSGNHLTAGITATAPAGFEISLAAGSGYVSSVTIPQTSGTVNSTVVYVRSAAGASTGSISGNVLITSAGASDQTVAVTGMVNALPAVNTVANQTVNNGAPVASVNFTGIGNTFTWVNDTPGIGLAAGGTGDIASFTAVNTGSSPVVAKITVTPSSSGYAYVPNIASNNVSVINTATNIVETTIPVGAGPYGVAETPDGSKIYVTNFNSATVSVIDATTKTVIATIPVGASPLGIAMSPDGSRVYVANSYDYDVSVISTSTNNVIATILLTGYAVSTLSVSQDGKWLYATGPDVNEVVVVDLATNTIVSGIGINGLSNVLDIATSPVGNRVYALWGDTGKVFVINSLTNTLIASITLGYAGYGCAVSPDGSRVYVTNVNNSLVSVINTANNTVVGTISVGISPEGISVTPDGSSVYVANDNSNSVSIISTATNTVTNTVAVGQNPHSVGNFIAAGTDCTGVPISFTITVNPSSPTITTGMAIGTISACVNTASASPQIQQFTVSGSGLTAGITATAPAGFELSLATGSGYGSSVTIPQTSGAVSSTVVYVRSAATALTGSISGNVTLTSAGAGNQTVAVTGTVNAAPTVNTVANQTVNNGAPTTAVNFTGTGNTFTWVNDTPGIGLAASGTGNIASFTAINTGNSPVVATITTTPLNAGFAYVPSVNSNNVSVINTITNMVVATIPVGSKPMGVSVSPDGSRVYVVNSSSSSVSVINTATNMVIATVVVGPFPNMVAVSPDGSRVYVTNGSTNSVSVINCITNVVVATIQVGSDPEGVLVAPDGSQIYVADAGSNTVSVINTVTNGVINIPVGNTPLALAVSPDGSRIYVTNNQAKSVSVINTITNMVVATIQVGALPNGITVSPDGSKVYVANNSSSNVAVINTATNTVISTIITSNPVGLSLSPDGSKLYVTSGNVTVINTATGAVITTIAAGNGSSSIGNFISSGTGCTGTPIKFTITVEPSPPIITAGSASGTISACTGAASASPNIQQFTVSGSGLTGNILATAPAGFEVSLASGNGYGSSVTITQNTGAVNGTVVYVRSAASLPNGTTTANVQLSSPGAPGQTVSVTGTVNPIATASLAIAASGSNICAGSPVTFTATPTNGGISPVYQWLLNGSNAGTNSPTFSSSTFANGDVVSCVMTSSYACATPANTTSNSITMNVTPDVIPTISIAASQNTICAGTLVTFTAMPINGGNAPVYQWLVNGNNAGTNSTTFSSSNFADGDIVTCIMTSNAGCATPASVTSNSINMSVSPFESPAIGIVASQNNICPGTNITFTATPTNGGNTPVYQWLLNGNNTGLNSPTFSSSTLSNGDVISCRLNSNATCLTIANATSNNITITVNAQVAPAVSINLSANNVCAGTSLTLTATPTNGGNTPIYQWMVNGNNAGTNSQTFSSSTFANGDVISCVMMSSAGCATPASATSNSIIANIFPLPVVNGGGNKTIENGSTVALNATASGNITDITWSPSTGLDNNKILTPHASPAATTSYTITVQTASGCVATDVVTVTVFYGIVIPNTFTPNGDGVNDKWDIKNLNDYQNCNVRIFDRYGGLVYSSIGYYNAWDGTAKGRPVPVGTYYYVINLNNGTRPMSGFVALIR